VNAHTLLGVVDIGTGVTALTALLLAAAALDQNRRLRRELNHHRASHSRAEGTPDPEWHTPNGARTENDATTEIPTTGRHALPPRPRPERTP
jgi:hypothetical protein